MQRKTRPKYHTKTSTTVDVNQSVKVRPVSLYAVRNAETKGDGSENSASLPHRLATYLKGDKLDSFGTSCSRNSPMALLN